jgi:hypothetical protein
MSEWDINYPDAGDGSGMPQSLREPTPRAESHPNPIVVFIDIYGAVKYLTQPGNLQLRGRRGVGKTIYLLSAEQKIASAFRRKGKIISAYADLSDLASLTEAAQSSPYFYINQIYQRILSSVVQNVFYPENDTRISRDLTSLAEEQPILQRYRIKNKLAKLKAYLDGAGDPIATQKGFEERNEIESAISAKGTASLGFGPKGPETAIGTGFNIEDKEGYSYNQKSLGAFEYRPATVRKLLDEILRAFRVDHLILFLDEFSTNHLPQRLQPYLIRKLIETFDGSRFSLKFATIPGATTLSIINPAIGRVGVQMDDRIRTFDFDDESVKRPQVIRSGNLHVFLKNLAFANPGRFRKYIVENGEANAQIAAFKNFATDYFKTAQAFAEFLASGEGLPRKLFDTFNQAYLRTSNMDRKLERHDIWIAANDHCKQKIHFELSTEKECMQVLTRIYVVDSRIFKIEKAPEYIDAIERIAALGFIHACPVSPTKEVSISEAPLEFYYTSYATEVYFQISRILTKAAGAPSNVQLDDMTYIPKSKYNQLYFKAKTVLLRDKDDKQNKAKRTKRADT